MGHKYVYPISGGEAQKVTGPRFPHFVAPLPVINDRSLMLKTGKLDVFVNSGWGV